MSEPKHYKVESNASIGIKESVVVTKTHKSYNKRWLIIFLTWIVTVAIQAITSFIITGCVGFILGIVLSAIPFFLGFWAVTRVIEKETWHS
jgi:Na+/H+-translocating membrane pyrophosphatase